MKWAIHGDDSITKVSAFAPKAAKAYCEGRYAHSKGLLVIDNPHTKPADEELQIGWNRGWFSYDASIPAKDTYCAV